MGQGSTEEGVLGRWRSVGYGWLLEVQPESVRRWDEYDRGLVIADQWKDARAFDEWISRVERRGDHLSFVERDVVTRYEWVQVHGPGSRILRPEPDPSRSFTLLREAFDGHYACFDRRGAGWVEAGGEAERALARGDEDPFESVTQVLRSLEDRHVKLLDGAGERVGRSAPDHPVAAVIPDEIDPGLPTWERIVPWAITAFGSVMGEDRLSRHANGRLVSTVIDDVGYVAIMALDDLTDGAGASTDLEAADAAMAEVAASFARCRSVVVDVRCNGGGDDPVALAIAGWFADRERLAWTKCARAGDGWTQPQPVSVRPSPLGRIDRPVILVTGSYTASAAEAFVLAMRVLPSVTVAGAPTAGVLSDQLLKHLPNGWRVTISNERCQAADGQVYEAVGIPVDVPIRDDLIEGGGATLRAALDLARA